MKKKDWQDWNLEIESVLLKDWERSLLCYIHDDLQPFSASLSPHSLNKTGLCLLDASYKRRYESLSIMQISFMNEIGAIWMILTWMRCLLIWVSASSQRTVTQWDSWRESTVDWRVGSLSLRVLNLSHADDGGLSHCPLESLFVSLYTLAIREHEWAPYEWSSRRL